jgi:LacI family transcriptional regulator, galactose operon repressor
MAGRVAGPARMSGPASRSGPSRLRDVAQAARVSTATVSRYLNGTLVLSPPTAERIERAILALSYRPNPHARRLSLGRAETIGLVIPEIANPFFARMADAIELAAEAEGLGLLLCATRNRADQELAYLGYMRRTHVDGVLFATNHTDGGDLARAIDSATGVVLIDEDIPGTTVPKVFADNAHGGYLAGQHLIRHGHRRISFIGGPHRMFSTMERLGGLREAVREAGPPAEIVCEMFGEYTSEHGRAAARALLQLPNPPTAAFTASDELALGVLGAMASLGLAVPENLSLIAFDDVGPLHLLQPPLTTIRQPVAEMGREGLRLLLARLRGEPVPSAPVRLPVQLIERQSVAPPRAPRPTGRASINRRVSP